MLSRQVRPQRLLGACPSISSQILSFSPNGRAYSQAYRRGTEQNTEQWHGRPSSGFPTRSPMEDLRAYSLIKKQLHHFDDPYHMARHVESELEHGRFEQALVFTRKASVSAKCVVSWNYLIRHMLREQRMRAAIKLYNEMKKRGQQPNAQTYTIIFSGLARSEHSTLAVAEAIKLYQSMTASDKIQPNEIHLNAVVNVCARAQDIDAMFSVIQTADDRGQPPTRVTYAIILHALRASIEVEAAATRTPFMTPEQLQRNRDVALQRCKSIWDEVIRRWRAGKLLIDEELVCAMGRILLLGNKYDAEAVLDLIEQTMKVPNMHAREQQKQANSEDSPPLAIPATSGLFVRPGNNTLSLILQALTTRRLTTMGMKYWTLLTTRYRVVPDSNNWHWLMTSAKRGHASGCAAEIVELMPRKFLNYTTFRMAITTCWRDIKNPNVYKHADSIATIMRQTLAKADAEATRDYLTIITSRLNRALALGREDQDVAAIKSSREHFKAVLASINATWEPIHAALEALEFKGVDHNALKAISGTAYNETAEYMSIARRLVALYDQVLRSAHFPKEVIQDLKQKRGSLIRHITSFYVPNDVSDEAPQATADDGSADRRQARSSSRQSSRADAAGDEWGGINRPARADRRSVAHLETH